MDQPEMTDITHESPWWQMQETGARQPYGFCRSCADVRLLHRLEPLEGHVGRPIYACLCCDGFNVRIIGRVTSGGPAHRLIANW